MEADSNYVSTLVYPTALCNLGPQKQFSIKWKMNNLKKKKNSKNSKNSFSASYSKGEKKFTTFAM